MTLPPDFGIPHRLDYYVDGPIEKLEEWVLEEMAERGDDNAITELARRGLL